MRRNVLFAGLLVAGLLSLSGCGDKEEAAAAGGGGPPGGMQLPVETVTVQPQALVAGLQTVWVRTGDAAYLRLTKFF